MENEKRAAQVGFEPMIYCFMRQMLYQLSYRGSSGWHVRTLTYLTFYSPFIPLPPSPASLPPSQVYSWLSDRGWPFLFDNVSIGSDSTSSQKLIQLHDTFEGEAKVHLYCNLPFFHCRNIFGQHSQYEMLSLEY